MDKYDKSKRSEIMRTVKSKNTKPEKIVRSVLHSRLHRKDLPGHPDIVLPKYKTVIFVHGCFWHRHDDCPKSSTPKSNIHFWEDKFDKNKIRDNANYASLHTLGWTVIVIWECQTKDIESLKNIIAQFLGNHE